MSVAMLVLVLLGMVITSLLAADQVSKKLAWGALVVLLASFGAMWAALETGRDTDDTRLRLAVAPVCLAVVAANLAFGLVSSFCAAVTLGLVLFASSMPSSSARLAYGVIASGYLFCAVLVQWGLFAHRPLLPVNLDARWQWWAGVVAAQLLYAAAYASGRAIRSEQKRIVREFERAVRETSQREALLAEARDAIKHGAGLGAPGRFTDQELDGFRLGAVIGRGGMGEVYAAERLLDGSKAAVKLLRIDMWGEKQALSRFARETRIVASIDSPHVVRVLGVSGAGALCPYLAMEHLEGVDLGSHLRDHRRMPLDEVNELVAHTAAGLSAAHAANVVHRDLKPHNVFRAARGDGGHTWKILDFGVSKLMGAGEASLTAAEIVGTPQYMAPEQVRGERNLDARADVYALSAICYRALVGEAPYQGDMHSVLRAILDDMPEAPSARVRLPEDLDLVLALGLAKRREDRFASADELACAFAQGVRGELDSALRARARTLLGVQPYRAAKGRAA